MGKKKRPQGKPEQMTLAEFNKQAPVNMSIPRGGGISGTQWDRMDLSMSKDPEK